MLYVYSMLSIRQTFLSNFFQHTENTAVRTRANKFNRELEKESNEIVKIVGIVFRNLSKGFDCTPHDLLLVKMESLRTFLLFYVHSSSFENNP